MTLQRAAFMVDGKPVRVFLVCRLARVETPSGSDLRPVLWQVDAFDKDHAIKRVVEYHQQMHAAYCARFETSPDFEMPKREGCKTRDWEILEELSAEHDIGMLGTKLPLYPAGVNVPIPPGPVRQH